MSGVTVFYFSIPLFLLTYATKLINVKRCKRANFHKLHRNLKYGNGLKETVKILLGVERI